MMTWARFLGAIALVFSFTAVPMSCGGERGKRTAQPDSSDEGETEKSSDAYTESKAPKGKQWGGWRWKGKRDDCFFVYKNQCYNKQETACKAAKCKKGACIMDKSAPAKISCKK